MALTQDFTDTLKDMMGSWPMDTAAMEDAWKTSAGFSEKASAIALDAAGKTTEISVGWTMETLDRMGDLSKAKPAPVDYAQAMADFASSQVQSLSDHMAAYGDVAKSVQTSAFELLMAVGKDMADDVTATAAASVKATEKAAEKATTTATTAAKRPTAAAKKAAAEPATPPAPAAPES
ncbi:phasin [Salipiger sp. P9]|uniref:phasin n=1 Tax=Salipiger pentaromativorans TaxID=2943193 RepID=UPI00215897E5|nr:phasin [Salipiger pentaromativorans]MCR8547642.1 phasin [Salipiger pentaromativorans]